jgi:hypothetical protein
MTQLGIGRHSDFIGVILGVVLAPLGQRLMDERPLKPDSLDSFNLGPELNTCAKHLEIGLTMKIVPTNTYRHSGSALGPCRVNVFNTRRFSLQQTDSCCE